MGLAAWMPATAAPRHARPLAVPLARPDALEPAPLDTVRIGGWLGHRIDVNARVRLAGVDTAPLLAGFQHRPGSHPWIGEHIGKWMHAATLAWAHQGDPALRARLDRAAAELIAAQEADGYVGTYEKERRFGLYPGADWDVWSHKYALLGLLSYQLYTGNEVALAASRRAADLLLATFPAERSILHAGTHDGMAATSVLEPMVLLYRATGDARYLAFCHYLVGAWQEAGGPRVLAALRSPGAPAGVAGAKAYELLSNLVGVVALARVTGDEALLRSARAAWQDIVDHRRYPTGTTSQWEHFQRDGDWADDVRAHLGETCVTTTWLQLNLALLQADGDARFAEEIERSAYNHLSAAQHPAGDDWCYFTPLKGRKPYQSEITCCHSSGPRGLALLPLVTYLAGRHGDDDALHVSTFEPSSATLRLGGTAVTVVQRSGFPLTGQGQLTLQMARPARFALRVRVPSWAPDLRIAGARAQGGWLTLPARTWQDGDVVPLHCRLQGRTLPGEGRNAGRAALAYGPFVLAFEGSMPPAHRLGVADAALRPQWQPGGALRLAARLALPDGRTQATWLPTFADAGGDGQPLQVWLRAPGRRTRPAGDSLLLEGLPAMSGGQHAAPLNDDDQERAATTRGAGTTEHWFSVTLPRAAQARLFAFTPGVAAADGGWFDTSGGKPRLQVQRRRGGAWHTIGLLDSHPDATATDPGVLGNAWDRKSYVLELPAPVRFIALRVIGRPAGAAAYASCAELQALAG